MKRWIALVLALVMAVSLCACGGQSAPEPGPKPEPEPEPGKTVDQLVAETVAGMTTEQKLAQMMVVAFRSDSDNTKTATELTPAYEELLKKYDFGGVILFSGNFVDVEQTITLIQDCQTAAMTSQQGIPLLICVDQEGGLVNRVSFGVTGPGNMALAAAGDPALTEECADMLGQEISALGFNMDFAPVSDVNNNPNNPIIGIRSFSDDPALAAQHVTAFLKGLEKNNISAALKHFPGHGNVGEDSHTGLPSSELTVAELKACELVPFEAGISAGADMIMTAHIQYPNIEKETYVSKLDGKTVYLPATLSHTVITGLLREELGYDGIVITDSMVMDAIAEHFDPADAAQLAINAGVDLLLCPVDLYQDEEIDTFPAMAPYMQSLLARVESGAIKEAELDDSVARILKLKYEKDIMTNTLMDFAMDPLMRAKNVVGSAEHLTREWKIAQRGMTLVKNEGGMLPLDGSSGRHTLILATNEYRMPTVEYALARLEKEGLLDGSTVTAMTYSDLQFEDEQLQTALADADQLVILSQSAAKNELVEKAIERIHRAEGGRAVLLSLNLPYDAATYGDVDAILCAYHPYGDAHDADGNGPFNLNLAVALCSVFGQSVPRGKLPVNVPKIEFAQDGSVSFSEDVLYDRGFGLENWG